ncbi:hypothetical protein PFICI_12974 [Pestalotiopsis fici W106-1]|uniref:DUF7580 domain-containing protein n=1 Tax=Pestalotiopsis fici (strain W106-1 / CGMCC3.15140) TaxID=1229662 RepID=W3WQ67_PESFW|nr:uncharacterized protein PFICI_12974 [Pestalotiopsis fici W106-1]ETS76030.1 hypothetical protein PFICI_12974 [Pestalotiopsis fici W106-1]
MQNSTDPQRQSTEQPHSQSGHTAQKRVKFQNDRDFGLSQHYPDRHNAEATSKAAVDIIAMHGLRARSPKTWIAWKKDGDATSGEVFWLKDEGMLPSAIPDSRISTYNWNADYVGNPSHDLFLGHADSLLRCLDMDREETALVRAAETFHPAYQRTRLILRNTVGIAFLGTPFRGSWRVGHSTATTRVDLAKQENVDFNKELIQYLRNNSRHDAENGPSPLDEVVQKFSEMLLSDRSLEVVCFYERFPTVIAAIQQDLPADRLPTKFNQTRELTVSRDSACLDGHENVGLDVRHNMLHKHNSPTGAAYREISAVLQRFAKNADQNLAKRGKSNTELLADQPLPESTRVTQKTQNRTNYEEELLMELQHQRTEKCKVPLYPLYTNAVSGRENPDKTANDRAFFEIYLIDILSSEKLREDATGILSDERKEELRQERVKFCTLLDSIANQDIQHSNQAAESPSRCFSGSGKYSHLEKMLNIVSLSHGPFELATETSLSMFQFQGRVSASSARLESSSFRGFLKTLHGQPSSFRKPLHAKTVDITSSHHGLSMFERQYRFQMGKVLDMMGAEFARCDDPKLHTDHKVMMQLYDVETWKEKISGGGVDFHLSCPKSSEQSSSWQSALCTFQAKEDALEMKKGLCNTLKSLSRRARGLILVMSDAENTASYCVNSLHKHDESPTVYTRLAQLVNVLEAFGPRSRRVRQHYKFNYIERRKLAAKLALVLLASCSWNHTTCPWDGNEVQFLGSSASAYDSDKVYITCYIGSESLTETRGSDDEYAPIPAFTKFAKLLLEIEFGCYSSGDFSEDNDYGYTIVKKWYETEREDHDPSKDSYLDAVEACLEFDRLYMEERTKAAGRSESEEETSRRLIRTLIVSKIMSDLDSNKKRKWREV